MSHIYTFESTLYGAAGKRPWSSEDLSSEFLACKLLSNKSLEWYDQLTNNMQMLAAEFPWNTYRKQLQDLAMQLSDSDIHMIIGKLYTEYKENGILCI
jgi:hypothetical protein